jgi:dTDP-4-dehydrorhamnose reductase
MTTPTAKVLVLGASGMLGNAVLRFFSDQKGYSVFGSIRSTSTLGLFPEALRERLISSGDLTDENGLLPLLERVQPDLIINCIGIIKQLAAADDVLTALPLNTLLPHRLLRLCRMARARLIHISTDCVFAGTRGMYREQDRCDARDLYGLSKWLGEVDDERGVTLRTSIIGPELAGSNGLLAWFLSQRSAVRGYTQAVFSGLPTVELARVIHEHVIPNPQLHGVYHVSAEPINKYELLKLIAGVYGRDIEIAPDADPVIDRSLDSTRFRAATGYRPPDWPELVRRMHQFG